MFVRHTLNTDDVAQSNHMNIARMPLETTSTSIGDTLLRGLPMQPSEMSTFFMNALLWAMLMLAVPGISCASSVSLDLLAEKVARFQASDAAQFAPATTARAVALLSAARKAEQSAENSSADTKNRANLKQIRATLSEAKQTASGFQKRYARLIQQRQDATDNTLIIESAGVQLDGVPPKTSLQQAATAFARTITAYETGQMNNATQQAAKASDLYLLVLKQTLPPLSELTAIALHHAAHAGAKMYTPQIYSAAQAKQSEITNYIDGISDTLPEHPALALYLAREAKHVTGNIKAYRKKSSSYETLILHDRRFKTALAEHLDLPTASTPMLADISEASILKAITKLTAERAAHQRDLTRLKAEYQQQLRAEIARIKATQQQQVSSLKGAFQAKLERETFEKKRQEKLRQLFKQHQVKILVNLDGSILIRLTALKFNSGRSTVEEEFFPMLEQLKAAMDLYQDRTFRIEGHTDDRGEVRANQILSLRRAEAVRDYLIAHGAQPTHLKALGYGEVRPIASNEFAQGREMNRRIDVVISAPAPQ